MGRGLVVGLFAFTFTDDFELEKINNSYTMKFCEFLPSFSCIQEADKFSKLDLK